MLIKTHLAIAIFFILLFLSFVEYKLIFVLVTLFATFIPDIDSRFSTIGQKKIMRLLQWFTRHRGIIHSFTFLLIVVLFLILFFPIISLPFFLGFGLHLFADSFTIDGIIPFYPLKRKISGKISTGGKAETSIFVSFIILDLFLLLNSVLK